MLDEIPPAVSLLLQLLGGLLLLFVEMMTPPPLLLLPPVLWLELEDVVTAEIDDESKGINLGGN